MRALAITTCLFLWTCVLSVAQETDIIYLSGTGSDQTVNWDFYCTEGRNSGKWTEIAVPSCWELEGFGQYTYGHTPWEERLNEEGHYRTVFRAEKAWKNKQVEMVFEGVMTDAEVRVNGKLAGPTHQGAFYEFSYDISPLLVFGKENKLEVKVKKHSENNSINHAERKADFWIFGGIFRPVYLSIKPKEHIERIAIKAESDGSLEAHIFHQAPGAETLRYAILTAEGDTIKQGTSAIDASAYPIKFSQSFSDIVSWNPESPTLYSFEYSLVDKDGRAIHQQAETIGFRTVEVRERDGIYVNGQKIKLKGVNRHTFWPGSGRTTNKNLSRQDILLMKEMNMNAVRMSHYPPDKHFLDMCDSLGLFVIDELCTWQAPALDTEVGEKLVKELVIRDVNHPSIILWANGNEGGFNFLLDDDYWIWDIQRRAVIHPWSSYGKINTTHYINFNYLANDANTRSQIFLPTEFLHGLYDGGHGAGLEDYWRYMWDDPLCAGGFLWVFADESVKRTDKGGALDSDGDHAPDGILGPYREKEGSFYTIKDIWSPVQIADFSLHPNFNGEILIENRYHFTDLKDCSLKLSWTSFSSLIEEKQEANLKVSETISLPSTLPGERSKISLPLPENWQEADALTIEVLDPNGQLIHTVVEAVKPPMNYHRSLLSQIGRTTHELSKTETDTSWVIRAGKVTYTFSKKSGLLLTIRKGNKYLPFHKGPVALQHHKEIEIVSCKKEEEGYRIYASAAGGRFLFEWTVSPSGVLHLFFTNLQGTNYGLKKLPYDGLSFSLSEEEVTGMKWIGDGPYRVWRNRMRGPSFGIHGNTYNNTITGYTGSTYQYPEFKGFYANFYGANISLKNGQTFTILCHTSDYFLRMFTPEESPDVRSSMKMDFPPGDISFMRSILPIGTKFKNAEQLGPQSQANTLYNFRNFSTTVALSFYFGE
ncbi:MAG: glycoside hydrolase family 2 TIM barrel-domain containing protein [Bacteroidota bacterium]